MRKSSKCNYKIGVNIRNKKKFLKPEDAIKEAERLNKMPNVIKKFVAYKCTTCFFFHVGRTNEDTSPVEFEKLLPKQVEELKLEPVITLKEKVIIKHDDFDWDSKNKYNY